jgi:hypothetical protein
MLRWAWAGPGGHSEKLYCMKISCCTYQQHTSLHPTASLPLKLSRVGPGRSLDGRPDGVGWPEGGSFSSGQIKYYNNNIPMLQGSDWGHCLVNGAVFRMGS